MTEKKNNPKKDWKSTKIFLSIIIALFIIVCCVGVYFYRSFTINYKCETEINTLRKQHPNIDWNKQVEAEPLGLRGVKTIPLSFAEQVKCTHTQKAFFLF